MNKILKEMVIIFSIIMLSFVPVNGQNTKINPTAPVIQNVKSNNKWIMSRSKKFEYRNDFNEIRYKSKIYKLPKQLKQLPKNIQIDIQKEINISKAKKEAEERAKAACYKKPVIYLYPAQKQSVNVKIKGNIKLTSTYPEYKKDGWNVVAFSNGTIVDEKTKRSYYCLYWEGLFENKCDMSKGFVVKGGNTAGFLEENLKKLGLTEREANEFIIYWLPQLEKNKYNLVHFATDEYNKEVPLEISPKPDSLIRVLMAYKPLDKPMTVEPQKIVTPKRNGFTVVEWGGIEIKSN